MSCSVFKESVNVMMTGQKRDKYHQDEIRDKQSLRPDAFYAFGRFCGFSR